MKTKISSTEHIKKLCCVAMFCALAFVVSFCFPIKVQFLTFDAKDSVIAVCGLFFGPVAAVSMSLIVPFLEFLTYSETGLYGLIMNFLSSAAFSLTASLIYKYRRKLSGAVIGLICSVFITTAVMLCANYFITPIYAEFVGFPIDIIKEIPRLFLPFNLTKTILNSALVLLLYKPFTTALRAVKLVPASTAKKSPTLISAAIAVCALLLIAASFTVYFVFLDASFSFLGK